MINKLGVRSRTARITALVAGIGAALAIDAAPAAQAPARGLFLNPGAVLEGPARGVAAAARLQAGPMIVRSRLADIDVDLLGGEGMPASDPAEWQAGRMVALNLFDDASFLAILDRIDRNPSGSYTWVGHLASDPLSSVQFVVNEGIVVGTVHTGKDVYSVLPADGSHIVHQMDPALFPPSLEPIPVDISAENLAADPPVADDDGSRIDVLIVWTPAARAAAGGLSAIQALADGAISATNTAYLNSSINTQVRLVHKEEVAYTEDSGAPGGNAFSNGLAQLRSTTDGIMDNVHALRDTYGADLVGLLIHDSTYCGLAYLMTTESVAFAYSGFSVTAWNCAVGNFSFPHELGHNQGLDHDRYVNATPGLFPYSNGYSHIGADSASSWRTIMAYSNECFANFNPFSCTRVQYFSNPVVNYLGNPTGVISSSPDSADNAQTLNNSRDTVASFRAEIPDAPPAKPTSLVLDVVSETHIDLSWVDVSADEDGFKLYRNVDGGSFGKFHTTAANVETYADTGFSGGTVYCYKLRSFNVAGASGYSNTRCTAVAAPTDPTGMDASVASNSSVTLTWNDTSDNEDKFKLYRKPSGGSWSKISEPAADAESYVDTGLTGGDTYCYKVLAKNAVGSSGYSNKRCITVDVPKKPTGVLATAPASNLVDVTWNDKADNEDKLKIYRRVNGGSWSKVGDLAADTTAFVDNSVSAGNEYCYRLRAKNILGQSSYSAKSCVIPA